MSVRVYMISMIWLVLGLAFVAGCEGEPAEPEPEPEPPGQPTFGRLEVGELELEVKCPPGWRCAPDAAGLLRHARLAASVAVRRSSADSAEELLNDERLRRVQEQRALVDEHDHALGLVQQTVRQLRGGAQSRSWALVRAVDGVPIVCSATAAAVDYPDLLADFDALCTSLSAVRALAPDGAPPQDANPDDTALLAVDRDPALAELVFETRPALPRRLALVDFGMARDDVVAALPELGDGLTHTGPFEVRAGFWGPREALTALTFSIDAAELALTTLAAGAERAWGPPLEAADASLVWTDAPSGMQATLDAPTSDRVRLVLRRAGSLEALLGSLPQRLGFEHADAPLLGLSQARFAEAYAALRYDEAEPTRLALDALPWGGAVAVEVAGEPIEAVTLSLDVSRHPPALAQVERLLRERCGAPSPLGDGGALRFVCGERVLELVPSASGGGAELIVTRGRAVGDP